MRRPLAVCAAAVAVAASGLLAVPTAAAGGGCGEDVGFEHGVTTVVTRHACFGPTVTQVPVGETVTFVNESGLEHNITGPGPIGFNDFQPDAKVALTFSATGIFPYACTFHPGMAGAVVVGDPIASAPPADVAVPAAATPAVQLSSADDGGGAFLDSTSAVVGTGAVVAGGLGLGGALVVRRRRTALTTG